MRTKMLRTEWAEWIELKGFSELQVSWKARITKCDESGRKKTAELQRKLRESYGDTPNYENNVHYGSIKTTIVYRDLDADPKAYAATYSGSLPEQKNSSGSQFGATPKATAQKKRAASPTSLTAPATSCGAA